MNHTTNLNELLTALSVGVMGIGVVGFGVSFADADFAYFDPRPLLLRALENRVGGQLLCDVTGFRYALRDGLLGVDLFLSPIAAPKGALR